MKPPLTLVDRAPKRGPHASREPAAPLYKAALRSRTRLNSKSATQSSAVRSPWSRTSRVTPPSPTPPTADLEAHLDAMRLGDPSSSPPLSPQSPPRVLVPTAGVYAQQPGATTDFSAWGGDANDHPYTSAGLIVPPSNANQSASRGPVAGNPDRSRPALQNDRPNDLLNAVQRARTPGDLEAIVNRVTSNHCNGGVPLMEVAEPSAGEAALKELVRNWRRCTYAPKYCSGYSGA